MSRGPTRLPRVSKASAITAAAGSDDDGATSSPAGHDLEVHLVELRALDALRLRSGELRDQGCARHKRDIASPLLKLLTQKTQDPVDLAIGLRVLWETRRDEEAEATVALVKGLRKLQSAIAFEKLKKHPRPVILAAHALRALAAHPRFALSSASMTCWYWIIRELYAAMAPDWSIGGARAGDKGWVSAYTTAQCVLAVQALAGALDAAADYFEVVDKFETRRKHFSDVSAPWRDVEIERCKRSRGIALGALSARVAIELPHPTSNADTLQTQVVGRMTDVVAVMQERKRAVESWREGEERDVDEAVKAIKKEYEDKRVRRVKTQLERKRLSESESAHHIALDAIERGVDRAEAALSWAKSGSWHKLATEFKQAAEAVRSGMVAVYQYLSGVIDTQLAVSDRQDLRRLNVVELTFAARAYFCYQEPTSITCRRMGNVIRCLMNRVAPDGTIDAMRPYHAEGGGNFLPHDAEALTALAELMRYSRRPISLQFASKFFTDLTERCVMHPEDSSRLLGWRHSLSRPSPTAVADLVATADAVAAMAAINDMLDEGINDIVLEHFSVKEPEDTKMELDGLFYPDFGLDRRKSVEPEKDGVGRKTVALTLQKMRAHIVGGGKPTLHSLVLHGPAGTGKTTFVEALAKTCQVPMVEVTPSDIAKAGEAAIEQRARAVFEALSMLTRVVILFDEFDPVLKRRDSGAAGASSIFSFLTPGMLPKLKTLSDRAKERSVAYVLVTNLIGTLDEAAVRSGRFDEKVGVYPPDSLSRLGQLQVRCAEVVAEARKENEVLRSKHKREKAEPVADRKHMLKVVKNCAGKGMTALNKDGWFTRGKPDPKRDPPAPIDYIFDSMMEDERTWPAPEEILVGVKGTGEAAELEYRQWGWIDDWDKDVDEDASDQDVAGWTGIDNADAKAKEKANTANSSAEEWRSLAKAEDRHLLFGLIGDEILLRWHGEKVKGKGTGLFERAREWHTTPGKDAAKIRQQAKHPVFARGDLHVFDHCAAEVFKRPLFKEGAVATQVVYIAVLGHDLLEQQDRIKARANDSAVSDKELNDEWRRFRELLDELDAAAGQLYRRISRRYDEYIKAGGFGKAAAIDKDLLTRMNEARRRRLGDDDDPRPPSS